MSKTISKRDRVWLNGPKDQYHASCVSFSVDASRYATGKKGTHYYTNGYLDLRDCSRKVEFEFTINNKKDRKRAIDKIDRMIAFLYRFKRALLEADAENRGL